MRLFIALDLPDAVKAALTLTAAKLRERVDPIDKIHWVPSDSYHITLKFLGACRAEQVEPLKAALAHAADTSKSFALRLTRLGCFPARGNPLVLWAGSDEGTEQCGALAAKIETLCEPLGFARETRAYHPHITLARVKWSRNGKRLRDIPVSLATGPGACRITSISLMESELTPSGARYSTLLRRPLPA